MSDKFDKSFEGYQKRYEDQVMLSKGGAFYKFNKMLSLNGGSLKPIGKPCCDELGVHQAFRAELGDKSFEFEFDRNQTKAEKQQGIF